MFRTRPRCMCVVLRGISHSGRSEPFSMRTGGASLRPPVESDEEQEGCGFEDQDASPDSRRAPMIVENAHETAAGKEAQTVDHVEDAVGGAALAKYRKVGNG
uniref:Uncharacterized protein n=1 Tax=Podoviridae sp. ctiwu7 TaxID=2825269 RepID=A0A8S5QDI5_9CAUD|nr:MAG TPA: hypothetical protein [Podoviridae sp. ctiwu7]